MKRQLDQIQAEGLGYSSETAKQMKNLRDEMREICQQLKDMGIDTASQQPVSDSASSEGVQTRDDRIDILAQQLRNSTCALQSRVESSPKINTILGRLFFKSMFSREDRMRDAEAGTFEWILERNLPATEAEVNKDVRNEGRQTANNNLGSLSFDGTERFMKQKVSKNLCHFLEEENGVWFICGKAGSGKSTLMKLLAHHQKALDMLELWTSEKKFVLLSYYFSSSGDKLQMSLEGLYRTLIFETIRQEPNLIDELFPLLLETAGGISDLRTYSLRDLQVAFQSLIRTATSSSYRLCLFLDGLDEYEGSSADHINLARQLKEWSQSANVKIVCAARPHIEFLKTFTHIERTIHLQELTTADIERYIKTKLKEELACQDRESEWSNIHSITGIILSKAEGVFLWAYMAVQSILEGIIHEESLDSLRERLNTSDSSLESLFDKLMADIHPAMRAKSENFFLLALKQIRRPWNALMYSWVEQLDDADFPQSLALEPYSMEEYRRRIHEVRLQLRTLTKGLLEMRRSLDSGVDVDGPLEHFQVEFLHLSVKEYLLNRYKTASGETGVLFHKNREITQEVLVLYTRLGLACLKCYPLQLRAELLSDMMKDTFNIAPVWHPEHLTKFCKIDNELLEDAERVWAWSNIRAKQTSQVEITPKSSFDQSRYPFVIQQLQHSTRGAYQSHTSSYAISVLCLMIFYGQQEKLKQRLKDSPLQPVFPSELAHCLLLSSRTGLADSELVAALLAAGAKPSDRIPVVWTQPVDTRRQLGGAELDGSKIQRDRSTLDVWTMVAWDVAATVHHQISGNVCQVQAGELKLRHLRETIPKIIELYLANGADRDIWFACDDGPGGFLMSPEEEEQRSGDRPEPNLFYVDLLEIMLFFGASNESSLRKLLMRREPSIAGRIRSYIFGQQSQATAPSPPLKRPFKTAEQLRTMSWRLLGPVTPTQSFAGLSMAYSMFSHDIPEKVEERLLVFP